MSGYSRIHGDRQGTYDQDPSVASGSAPAGCCQARTGAQVAPENDRNPQEGLAASAPSHVAGHPSSDKPHQSWVDGHAGSVVAKHPNGQFALAHAATSNHSLHANLEHFTGGLRSLQSKLGLGRTGTTGGGSTQAERDARRKLNDLLSAWAEADTLPVDQVFRGDRDHLVRTPEGHIRWSEWTVPELAGVGLGALVVSSLAGKVF